MAYLRLIRIGNVLFIGAFQVLLRWGLVLPIIQHYGISPMMTTTQFALVVIATMALAASGNAINDYFDVRCDSINRPEMQIVDKLIDRKTAILIHVILTLIGVFCGLYIAFIFQKENYALFFIAIPIILWFYSTHFKKQMLIGNIVVAMLTALVAFLVVSVEISAIVAAGHTEILQSQACNQIWCCTAMFAFFAFSTNLAREIVKDMEDVDGDIACGGHTLPIEMGMRNSKIIVVILQIFTLSVLWHAFFFIRQYYQMHYIWLYLIFAITLPTIYIIISIFRAKNSKDYHSISKWCKIVMAIGVLILLFI